MGLFGFLENIVKATVQTAITPLAIVKDIVDGDTEIPTTKESVSNIIEDLYEATDQILGK